VDLVIIFTDFSYGIKKMIRENPLFN